MTTPQVVIDTNVLIAAQRSQRGASSKLMSLVERFVNPLQAVDAYELVESRL